MMKSILKPITLLFVGFLIINFGCDATKSVAKHATPEAAFEKLKSSTNAGDWKTACNSMTSESVNGMAGGMAMFATMIKSMPSMPGNENAEKATQTLEQIEKIMNDFGVTKETTGEFNPAAMSDTSALTRIGQKIKDKAGFIGQMMNVLKDAGGPGELKFNQTLSDVKIDGDSATGTLSGEGASDSAKFKKVDGGWLVEFDLNG